MNTVRILNREDGGGGRERAWHLTSTHLIGYTIDGKGVRFQVTRKALRKVLAYRKQHRPLLPYKENGIRHRAFVSVFSDTAIRLGCQVFTDANAMALQFWARRK